MESDLLDWARKNGLNQETINKLIQEDLNGFRALRLVDIPVCSKNLGLSLGQAAILEYAVKTLPEEDSKEKKEGQSVRSEANTEETVLVVNPTYDTVPLRDNTQNKIPLQRRRVKILQAPRSDRNPKPGNLDVIAERLVRRAGDDEESNDEITIKCHIVREDNKMKWFTRQLIQNVDNGDNVGIVIFGSDAEVFYRLTKITDDSKKQMLAEIEMIDSGRMGRETNLSAGLRMALKVFNDARMNPDEFLNRKNSILMFSDGEVNAGTMDPEALVHEVRQNIRQMAPSLDESTNLCVTISVVTTGSTVSEAAYLMSKICSNDAYYYVDNAVTDPTFAEVFLPVLLRKSAVAWNASLHIQTFSGICFVEEECTRNYKIRHRHKTPKNAEKAYFLYDFPAGKRRQIGITAEISNMLHSNDDEQMTEKCSKLDWNTLGEEEKGERWRKTFISCILKVK